MLDSNLRRLLEEAVNTSNKLAIVLLYAGQPGLAATPAHICERLYYDIWSVEEALQELGDAGVLVEHDGRYAYAPAPRWRASIQRLLTTYDEPLHRQEIMQVIADLERYAPYRDTLAERPIMVF